ncbi:MAG: matrixin family metalloprotease [Planctomycetota bacterium]|nr:matrixin family metalloprotease [Planctomycetota bacterium]
MPAQFTVRGRWPEPVRLSYVIEERGSPVPLAFWRAAVERACKTWNETGVVQFREAEQGAEADVTIGWRRGHHGACEPFGTNATVAHSGPVKPGTFIHFDAERSWQQEENDGDGYSIYGTAVHELGHVLGLGHTVDRAAVMRTGVIRSAPLARSDLAGLHSLYGGGQDGPGDLRVVDDAGSLVAVLRRVAPTSSTEWDLFDANGDGREDVVVWRTDSAGHGELMIYQFGAGAKLERTSGPFFGMSLPNRPNVLLVDAEGNRLLVGVYETGRKIARRFNEYGVLEPWPVSDALEPLVEQALAAQSSSDGARSGDLDGDGQPERVIAAGAQ